MPAALFPLLALGAALAASPTPDRPTLSDSAFLVPARHLELEVGGHWQQAFSMPAKMKLGIGDVFEPRICFDMAGIDQRQPHLFLAGKIGLLRQSEHGLAILLGSSLPVTEEERWLGSLRALFTSDLERIFFQLNAGLDMQAAGNQGLSFIGVPLMFAVGGPLGSNLRAYGEVGTTVWAGFSGWMLDTGLHWRVTDILVLDAAVGWDIDQRGPFLGRPIHGPVP